MVSLYRSSSDNGRYLRREDIAGGLDGGDEGVHLFRGVVDVKARPRRARNLQRVGEHLATMVPGPQRDAVIVRDLGEVVWVDSFHRKRYNTAALAGIPGPVDRHRRHGRELLQRVRGE